MRTMMLAFPVLLALGGVAAAQEIRNEDAISTIENAYQTASEKAAASVVAIRVDREPETVSKPQPGPGLRGRFGLPREDVFQKRPAAWCSGLVIEPSGVILTTNFNVSGKVKSIKVQLPDGRTLDGRLMGYNGTYDLAAIKVEAEDLPVLKRARLDDLKTGQPLLALGRAPDGRSLTVNPGIISAASRLSGKGIQIDSKLNYGNVGGPVVDLEGRLVAVSCKVDVKYATMFGQNSGVGFAITHDRLTTVLADLKAGKNEAEPRRPFLGVGPAETDRARDGAEVGTVQPGSAAERAGLKPKDVIIEFEGSKVGQFDELRAMIMRKSSGDRVKLKVLRGEEEMDIECVLGSALNELP